jgi:hypothetical protein
MSFNPDVEGVMSLRRGPDGAEGDHTLTAPIESVPVTPPAIEYLTPTPAPAAQPLGLEQAALVAPAAPEVQLSWGALQPVKAADRPRARRGWIGVVAVGVVGLIASGTLGYILYTTTGQRDVAQRETVSTQATLTSTQGTLSSAQQDLAARNKITAYVAMYFVDSGRVHIDYQKLEACRSFGSCRTAAQSALTDMQTLQADRSSMTAPAVLANSDGMLRDALSAAIAADQELISGMDNSNAHKFSDGWRKLSAAMLGVAKAEAVLGAELQ